MSKLSNVKNVKKSAEIISSPITRAALDASDLRANNHSFSGIEADYSLESTLDAGETAKVENVQPDPLAPYADKLVKLAYAFKGMGIEVDIKVIRGMVASVTASEYANGKDNPGVPVIIRCATTGAEILTVEPMKGARNVFTGSSTRQTSTRPVKGGMSEEEKRRIEAEKVRKEEERAARAWGNMVDEAEKENAKFDKRKAKELKEELAKLAKLQEKLRAMPKEGTDNFEIFKLFSEEQGLTCMEGNHTMNVLKNVNNSNYGWKQKGKEFVEKNEYNKVLIGQFRVCAIAYAKTGKTDKSMKEAMRLIDRDFDADGNLVIPDGWYLIQA